MLKLKLFIPLVAILAVSCASVNEMKRMDKFEQVTDTYELAIRWSDFEMASTFLNNQEDPEIATQIENLRHYKVTSYTVKRYLPSADRSQVLIIADVQFFKTNGLVVKTISHRQIWKYDKDKENWFLTSGLPDLK